MKDLSFIHGLHGLTFFWGYTVAYFLSVNMIQCTSLLFTVINSFSNLAFDLYINALFFAIKWMFPKIVVPPNHPF